MYLDVRQAFGMIEEVSRAWEDAFWATNRENDRIEFTVVNRFETVSQGVAYLKPHKAIYLNS